jgi:beta-lactamase class A
VATVLKGDDSMDIDAEIRDLFLRAGCTGTVCAGEVTGTHTYGLDADEPVAPASVVKVQIGLTVLNAIAEGTVDGTRRVLLPAARRTRGPAGISLLSDDVEMSVRDLITMMLTISDNVATDALTALVGLQAINGTTGLLGMAHTAVTTDLATMLDALAVDAGFPDYAALEAFQPGDGDPSVDEIRARLAASAALDPARGTHTTARDAVQLLRALWNDEAGPQPACAQIRLAMARQLTRHRIASGFPPDVKVAAKSGGLMGVVRNEVGVVGFADGTSYAVAVFTRTDPATRADPRRIDATVGVVAERAVAAIRR